MNKMKGYAIVRKSKERKMDRKSKHKALAVAKTEKSRQRRLDNKAKRDEIHAINPDAKITIINGITYMNGVKVRIIHGQIKSHLNAAPLINEPIIDIFDETVDEEMVAEIDKQKELHILMHGDQCICDVKIPTVEVFDTETEEVEAVEVDDVSRFQKLVKKWRL